MRLSDMYKVSTEVKFMPETEAEEAVLVVKLNEVEQAEVARKAGAARARMVAALRAPDSDAAVELETLIDEMDEDELITRIIDEDLEQRLLSVHGELAAEDEWSNDDYLSGLEEAWNGTADEPGLKLGDAESEDAKRVLAELSRFHDKVAERVAEERDDLRSAYEDAEIEYLREKAMTACVKRRGDQVFMDEYLRRRTFMSARLPDDRRKLYFESVEEYDECDEAMIKSRLALAYAEMSVEGVEGKDSPGQPGSSDSSEQPDTAPASAPSARPIAKRSKTSRASG